MIKNVLTIIPTTHHGSDFYLWLLHRQTTLSGYVLLWSLCFLFCRCGVQFGHLKALTRVLSLTPTVHHVSGSLAPSPIPMSSPSTLAARQTHPWTPSRSVSCGDRDWTWIWSEQGGEATAVITQNMPNVLLRLPNLDCQKSWWT